MVLIMVSNLGSLGGRRRRSAANGILSGFGAVPSQWTADSRVKALQSALNSQMGAAGCGTTLKSDGLIGPLTCGALAWSKATGSPPAAYTSYASDMDAGCRSIAAKAPMCPTAVVPAAQPVPVAVPAAPPAIISTAPVVVPAPVAPRAPAVPVVVPDAPVPQVAPIMASPAPAPPSGPDMKKIAIIGGAVLVVGVGAFMLLGKKKSSPAKAA
jgi:hypothetical protein